jgi:hypothetical protein
MSDQQEDVQVEVLPFDSLLALSKGEIDIQISTANAYPRPKTSVILAEAIDMATISQEVAESCNYSLPRKEWDKDAKSYVNKIIMGPSIRLAEIAVSCYGNIRASIRTVANDGKKVTSQARFHDLQKNIAIEVNIDRSILTSQKKTYPEHLQILTANAAGAIAFRNAAFKVIPGVIIQEIYKAAIKAATPTIDEMPAKRRAAIDYFLSLGVTEEAIFRILLVKKDDEIGAERLHMLRGLANSIKTGETTIESVFGKNEPETEKPPVEDDFTRAIAFMKDITTEEKLNEFLASFDMAILKTNEQNAEFSALVKEKHKSFKK